MMEPMSNLLLCPANLEAYLRDLPVAAAVLPRLQQLLLSDDTDVSEVVELVRFDPALATRVMHAAGSVFYGRARDITSLEDAIALLGLRESYRVTAAFAMSRFLNSSLRIYGLGPAEYWRRSLACALVMEQQAPSRGLDECVAYTAGLLHALGMILVDRHLRAVGDPGMLLREMPACPLPRQEARLIGMSHAQVSALVLRKWNFGPEIVVPIEYQFEPSRAPSQKAMTTLLSEARILALEVVKSMPPPGQKRGAEPETADSVISACGAKILALEHWMH
jgi:HD-like signal output (HDOD) protein